MTVICQGARKVIVENVVPMRTYARAQIDIQGLGRDGPMIALEIVHYINHFIARDFRHSRLVLTEKEALLVFPCPPPPPAPLPFHSSRRRELERAWLSSNAS